jgi:hypothetical protein
MQEIFEWIISIITNDSTLNAIVPPTQIFTGDVDIVEQTQDGLLYPMIVLKLISESQRTVPQGARDSDIELSIWSRNSMLECVQIYDRLVDLLSFQIANEGSAHIFWERLGSATDVESEDRRIWHRAATFRFWSIKP